MTPAELARLDAAATPGEWRWHHYRSGARGEYMKASDYLRNDDHIVMVHERLYRAEDTSALLSEADAALIVFLRNHTADFLAAMEERDDLEGTLSRLVEFVSDADPALMDAFRFTETRFRAALEAK